MKKTISINDMSCEHCESNIAETLKEVNGINNVHANSVSKKVTVDYETKKINEDEIKRIIIDIGYSPV